MAFFNKLEKGVNLFTAILSGIAGIMMALLTGFVFAEVLCRYVFHAPIVITSEMTNILFPWIVGLSAIAIAKDGGNTALVFVKEKFSGMPRHVLEVIIHVVMIYFSVVLSIASFQLSWSLRREILVLTHVSKALVYGSVFVGFVGVTIVVAFNLLKYILFDICKAGGHEK